MDAALCRFGIAVPEALSLIGSDDCQANARDLDLPDRAQRLNPKYSIMGAMRHRIRRNIRYLLSGLERINDEYVRDICL